MKFWLLLLFSFSVQIYAEETEKKEWWEYIDGSVKIKFQFKEILNHQFLVKGIWSPEGGEAGHAGPAELFFKDINNGSESKININYFSLAFGHFEGLDIVLNKNDKWYFNSNADLDKTYLVNYYDLNKMSLWNYQHQWYPQPIFFEDINFDGRKELITLNWASGQRHNHEFEMYQITTQRNQTKFTPYYPTNEPVDSSTEFDRVNRTLKTWSSGGACTFNNYKYQFDLDKYKLIEYTNADYDDENEVCQILVYDIILGNKALREKHIK